MTHRVEIDKQATEAKAVYSVPRLVVYGDLRTITLTMAKTGSDGGTMTGSTFST